MTQLFARHFLIYFYIIKFSFYLTFVYPYCILPLFLNNNTFQRIPIMDIKITDFVKNNLLTGNASDFSCSQLERGSYAGKGSYNHAVETTEYFSIVNEETRPTLEEFFDSFGSWDIDEIKSWSDEELNGVCLQCIAEDYKEWEFQKSEAEEGEDVCSGRYTDSSDSVDGEYYYYFGD